jgi:hypothetical protein
MKMKEKQMIMIKKGKGNVDVKINIYFLINKYLWEILIKII